MQKISILLLCALVLGLAMCEDIEVCRCRDDREVEETCDNYALDTCIADHYAGARFGTIFERDGNEVIAKEYLRVGKRCETYISQVRYTCGECQSRNGFIVKCGFSLSGSFLLLFLILICCCVCCCCAIFFLFVGVGAVVFCFVVAGVGTFAVKRSGSAPEKVVPATPADFQDDFNQEDA